MSELNKLDVFSLCLTWVTWIMSICIPLLAGKRHPQTWKFALTKQAVWLFLIFISQYWWVLPLWLGLTAAYTYNLFTWGVTAKASTA